MANGQPVIIGAANTSTSVTQLSRSGITTDTGLLVENQTGTGIQGEGTGDGDVAGVWGDATNVELAAEGVKGTSDYGAGVRGTSLNYGVHGHSTDSAGVLGESDSSAGVFGQSNAAEGSMQGYEGIGVVGSGVYIGALGQGPGVGVWGIGQNNAGVRGTSTGGIGVVAQTSGPWFGMYTYSGTGIGIYAQGQTFAADFVGDVFVDGALIVSGFKSAAVPDKTGRSRLLYAVESPEAWFEDFGRARLARGRARVALDREFAAVARTSDYHVFLTPEGNCGGLYVSRRTAAGFEVREQGSGRSSVAFSYRIVAKRKDIAARRFQKIKVPPRMAPGSTHLPAALRQAIAPAPAPGPGRPRVVANPSIQTAHATRTAARRSGRRR